MEYIGDIFFSFVIFIIAYIIFKFDFSKKLARKGIIEKDFRGCYILKYPKHAELHNKDVIYKIDMDNFFKLSPKLKGKIPVIERPDLDVTNPNAKKEELEERRKIREKYAIKDLEME